MKFLFPYEKIRPVQDEMMELVASSIENKKHAVIHAPTGVGKTAAVLVPALTYALENDKKIFFLTSRHTQHKVILETIRLIKEKFNKEIIAADIIGKKLMCSQKVAEKLKASEFFDYCKNLREDGTCAYYSNLKSKEGISGHAKNMVDKFSKESPVSCDSIKEICNEKQLCPYEISLLLAKDADIIVSDYGYVFDPMVAKIFQLKAGIDLDDFIVVIDEAHNLPARVLDNMSRTLHEITVKRAIKEAEKTDHQNGLLSLLDKFTELGRGVDDERLVTKEELPVDETYANNLFKFGELFKEENDRSACLSVADFLKTWPGQDIGYVRLIKKTQNGFQLQYNALDPGILCGDIIKKTHSTIAMSGTLTPPEMFRDILGFPEAEIAEFKSPFPEKNKLSLIIPATTTRYRDRSPKEYARIANVLGVFADAVPGNVAFFFPSYKLRDDIAGFLEEETNKKLLYEKRGMTKEGKLRLYEDFIALRKTGGILLGILRGSFGEGVDFPGDYLHGVVVVGLPLTKPDLLNQAVIEYYDKKFKKGTQYGYIYPAITLALQSAGRCIRSETDKGVIAFLDERYAFPIYRSCFPKTEFVITRDFEPFIDDFFRSHK